MKTILLPIEDHDEVGAIVATAANLARAYGSRCEAIGLTHFPYPTVGAEPILAVSLAPTFEGDEDKAQRFRGRFEEARSSLPGDLADQFRWRGGDPLEEPDLAALARVFDLTVIGRPSETPDGPRMTTLETVLFDSGRPILIAPPEARDGPIGRNVVLSWNGSTEGAETVTASLPILKAAERVTVLTVEGGTVAGP
ncbi:MAG: universal stress protein, partial [Pseudomonadota bacterium]